MKSTNTAARSIGYDNPFDDRRPGSESSPFVVHEIGSQLRSAKLKYFCLGLLTEAVLLAVLVALPILFPKRFTPVRNYVATALTGAHYTPVSAPKQAVHRVRLNAPTPGEAPVLDAAKAPIYLPTLSSPTVRQTPRHEINPSAVAPAPLNELSSSPVLQMASDVPALRKPPEPVQLGTFGASGETAAPGLRRAGATSEADDFASAASNNQKTSNRGVVQGQFGGTVEAAPSRRNVALSVPPRLTAVEILDQPRPLYTAEGRDKRIEGEVILQVNFAANGTIEIERVVRGLGYGLDDAAKSAAQKIKFHPATQDGEPVDTTAFVHVNFQLAY
jgi:protein TonB